MTKTTAEQLSEQLNEYRDMINTAKAEIADVAEGVINNEPDVRLGVLATGVCVTIVCGTVALGAQAIADGRIWEDGTNSHRTCDAVGGCGMLSGDPKNLYNPITNTLTIPTPNLVQPTPLGPKGFPKAPPGSQDTKIEDLRGDKTPTPPAKPRPPSVVATRSAR